jgi:hypothetical protein
MKDPDPYNNYGSGCPKNLWILRIGSGKMLGSYNSGNDMIADYRYPLPTVKDNASLATRSSGPLATVFSVKLLK